jgi:tRNA pseudouridine65 synthase
MSGRRSSERPEHTLYGMLSSLDAKWLAVAAAATAAAYALWQLRRRKLAGAASSAAIGDGVRLVHCDDDLVVVHKPSGVDCHEWSGAEKVAGPAQPGPGWTKSKPERNAADAPLAEILRGWPQFARPRWAVHLIHRLDRATSGLLLVGRSAAAKAELSADLEAGFKVYVALVRGSVEDAAFLVDRPLRLKKPKAAYRAKEKREALRDARTTQDARTSFVRLATLCDGHCSLLLAVPATGRWHQIRRHLEGLRHPISGDVQYSPPKLNRFLEEAYGLRRLFLHACCLLLPARRSAGSAPARRFSAALPADLRAPLERMPGGPAALARLEEALESIDETWVDAQLAAASGKVLTDTWRGKETLTDE